MRILIKGGMIIDPSSGVEGVGDLLIEDRKIRECPVDTGPLENDPATTVINA